MRTLRKLRIEVLQALFDVAFNPGRNPDVFIDFRRIEIDLADSCLAAPSVSPAGHTLAEPDAERQNAVTLPNCRVGCLRAVLADHAEITAAAAGIRPLAHQGLTNRGIHVFRQSGDFLFRIGPDRAASGQNDRPFRRLQILPKSIGIAFLKLGKFFLSASAFRLFAKRFEIRLAHLRLCDILGDVHKHRSSSAASRNAERADQGPRKVRYVLYQEIVLRNRKRNAEYVDLLEAVLSDSLHGNVTGDCHHRHTVHHCGRNSGHEVGRTGAARCHAYTGLSGHAGIPVRSMARALLMGRQNMTDSVIAAQCIIQRQIGRAGIPEHDAHALLTKTPNDDFRSGHGKSSESFLSR